jgi:hypothetical protein
MIEGALRMATLGWVNKLGGILFYFLLYFFVFSIVLFYCTQLHLIKQETIQTSVTYPLIYPMAPVILDGLGTVVPIFKNMFGQLENFLRQSFKKSVLITLVSLLIFDKMWESHLCSKTLLRQNCYFSRN